MQATYAPRLLDAWITSQTIFSIEYISGSFDCVNVYPKFGISRITYSGMETCIKGTLTYSFDSTKI